MAEIAEQLIGEMKNDVEVWVSGNEIDLESRYRTAIDAVGAVPFLAELFRRFGDATLTHWLIRLTFVWKDLPFVAWKQILSHIWDDTSAIYHFVTFVTEFLAIDIVRMIHEDLAVPETARDFAAARFPRGGLDPGSAWVQEMLADQGVDRRLLWRRLAAEGAPMKLSDPEIESLE